MAERRRDKRVPLKVQVFVRDEEYDGTIFFYTSNISTSGMFLESDLLLDEGTEFVLEFTLPTVSKFIKARGKVVWVSKPGIVGVNYESPAGMGVKFLEISEDDRKKVEEFIRKKLEKLDSIP